MVDFNFFLNRQGVRGNKGERGEQGYSPRITVKTETAAEYVLNVQNEDGSFDTPNLRGNAIENLGGTYVRYNQTTEQMYTGYADTASTTSQGEVTLSTYEDLVSGGDESEVTTSKDVHDFVEAKISEASVNYVDIDDYTQKMSELDGEISDLDNNKLDFTGLANTLAAGTNITITPNTSTGKITIAGEPVSQAQADWNQTDTDAPDYIKNKPTIPEAVIVDSELSSTSTNPVQNRLITNAINLISNEFENYATNKLDNLSNEGEARLHALKAYSDNGEVLTDAEGLADVKSYAHSTFDLSKFTVVGTPTISADGIASGFSNSNYLQIEDYFANKSTFKGTLIITTPDPSTQTGSGFTGIFASKTVRGFAMIYQQNDERINLYISSDGASWDIAAARKLYYILPNKTYKINFEKTLTKYYFEAIDVETGNTVDRLTINDSRNITATTGITLIGIPRDLIATENYKGSIDLKQFSITVDGVEVFSGNKTGIDTIKPDNYTVVGTPTISADGIASGFSSSNYLTTTQSLKNECEIQLKIKTPATYTETNYLIGYYTGYDMGLKIETSKRLSWLVVRTSNISQIEILSSSNQILENNTDYYIRFGYKNGVYYQDVSIDGHTWENYGSVQSTANPSEWFNNILLLIGRSQQWNNQRPFLGSIDLNAFKIYVEGNLVYQPCLKIPYTKSKTGSKIVNAIYRDRVNDMASQFGSANYYTLSDTDFTLPQVELYGLIEKAASTVPSGVVQSSTINNIVSLTQAEYDALVTKDSNTFYVIIPST